MLKEQKKIEEVKKITLVEEIKNMSIKELKRWDYDFRSNKY